MADVKAIRVSSYSEAVNPGNFWWAQFKDDKPILLHFKCPCGCDKVGGVSVNQPNSWGFDGNMDEPTITPSINFCREHWHGYLTAGVFKS